MLRALSITRTFNNSITRIHSFLCLVTCLNRVVIVYISRLMVNLRLAVIGIYVKCDDDGSVLHGIIRYNWFGAGMVAFVHHCGVGSGTVVLGVSREDVGSALCSILCYNPVGVGTVAFIRYCSIGAGMVVLGVSGCGVKFATSVWRSGTWFIVAGD